MLITDKTYTVAEARTNLTGILHEVEVGGPVRIARLGKAVAVLISAQDYERLQTRKTRKVDFWGALGELRSAPDFVPVDLTKATVDSWRDRSVGRDFAWTVGSHVAC